MLAATDLTTLTVPIHAVVEITFYLLLGAYAIFSGILYYHWHTYATDSEVSTYTLIVYFSTTVPLVLVMSILLLVI